MKQRLLVLGMTALYFVSNGAFAADVFSGNWKVNIAKSQYDPGPPPKGPNFSKVEVIEGGLKITNDGVNSAGNSIHNEWSAKFDGKDYPVKGDPNRDMVALRKIDDYTIEITSKKEGKVIRTVRIVHARDGKTKTETGAGTNAKGMKTNNVIVYEK